MKGQGAVVKDEQSIGIRYKKKKTAGQDLYVEWADFTTSCLPLRELKEKNVVKVAYYANSNSIIDKPAFDLQAPLVIKKRH